MGCSDPFLLLYEYNHHQRPLGAVACCPLLLLTHALLMTSSHSKADADITSKEAVASFVFRSTIPAVENFSGDGGPDAQARSTLAMRTWLKRNMCDQHDATLRSYYASLPLPLPPFSLSYKLTKACLDTDCCCCCCCCCF